MGCVHARSNIGSYKYKIAITVIAITMEAARKGALTILAGPARDRPLLASISRKGAGPSRRPPAPIEKFELRVRPFQVRSLENKRF